MEYNCSSKLIPTAQKKCNQRMNDSIQEVFLLSENVVESLRLEVIREVGTMYKVRRNTCSPGRRESLIEDD